MLDWWNSLELVTQIFYCIAIPATLVLLIQTISLLVGLGDDADIPDADLPDGDIDIDIDGDVDGVFGEDSVSETPDFEGLDGLRIFTVRGIVAFLVVFGWVGIVMNGSGVPLWITLPVATVAGFFIMVLLALLMKLVLKLRSNGNIDNRNAIGTAGKVYLTIPANRGGEGKVQLLLQGSFVERNAVTDSDEPLPTGSEVVVTGVSGGTTLIVRKK